MYKHFIILLSVALLLSGCSKEQVYRHIDGDLSLVSFSAQLDGALYTKSVADGDGGADFVNRGIIELYFNNELYARQYAQVSDKKVSFNVQVVSNRTYTVAFWADHVDNPSSPDGLQQDKYYVTDSSEGLKAVTIKGEYTGNNDARDAFYQAGQYTVSQSGASFSNIKLVRPFAQLNVITTDWDKTGQMIGGALPDAVDVIIYNPLVKFNVITTEASSDSSMPTLAYQTAVYPAPAGTSPASEKTLSMDYIFSSETKGFISLDFKAAHGTAGHVAHSFNSIPCQRNFRTNIKGNLLTSSDNWTLNTGI